MYQKNISNNLFIFIILFNLFFLPVVLLAESKSVVSYPYQWVYGTSLRLLKVDLKFEVLEENEKTGYILFKYRYKGIEYSSSVEIIDQTTEENDFKVLVRVVIDRLPSWVEEDLIDRLIQKLYNEYGQPPVMYKKKEKPKDEKKDKEEKDDKTVK